MAKEKKDKVIDTKADKTTSGITVENENVIAEPSIITEDKS